jgi:putative heme iron utilization protein
VPEPAHGDARIGGIGGIGGGPIVFVARTVAVVSERPMNHQVPTSETGGARVADLPPAPEPTHAERCRTLVAGHRRGSLSTIAADPAGYPYGSVVTYALDDHGDPLLFVSTMAEHTQNALADPRGSLLVAEPVPDGADPLASGRATLLGDLSRVDGAERQAVRDRYLAANPTSAYYIDFGDFAFFRLAVRSIRYVGGYGRMSWVAAADYAVAGADPLAGDVAAGIIAHMNADHAEAQVLFCRNLLGLDDTTAATMSSVDRYGFDMVAEGPSGRVAVRLGFPQPCDDGQAVRQAMVALVAEARAAG